MADLKNPNDSVKFNYEADKFDDNVQHSQPRNIYFVAFVIALITIFILTIIVIYLYYKNSKLQKDKKSELEIQEKIKMKNMADYRPEVCYEPLNNEHQKTVHFGNDEIVKPEVQPEEIKKVDQPEEIKKVDQPEEEVKKADEPEENKTPELLNEILPSTQQNLKKKKKEVLQNESDRILNQAS